MQVRLRDVVEADLPIFFAQQDDPAAADMASFPARDRQSFMAHWERMPSDGSVLRRTILSGEDVVGNVVSWPDGDQRLVGYWIGREHWGKGIATAALAAFLQVEERRPLHSAGRQTQPRIGACAREVRLRPH